MKGRSYARICFEKQVSPAARSLPRTTPSSLCPHPLSNLVRRRSQFFWGGISRLAQTPIPSASDCRRTGSDPWQNLQTKRASYSIESSQHLCKTIFAELLRRHRPRPVRVLPRPRRGPLRRHRRARPAQEEAAASQVQDGATGEIDTIVRVFLLFPVKTISVGGFMFQICTFRVNASYTGADVLSPGQ